MKDKQKKTDVMAMTGKVTVTAESDGTFFVRIGGQKFLRLPTRAAAEKRAAAVRRYDARAAA